MRGQYPIEMGTAFDSMAWFLHTASERWSAVRFLKLREPPRQRLFNYSPGPLGNDRTQRWRQQVLFACMHPGVLYHLLFLDIWGLLNVSLGRWGFGWSPSSSFVPRHDEWVQATSPKCMASFYRKIRSGKWGHGVPKGFNFASPQRCVTLIA